MKRVYDSFVELLLGTTPPFFRFIPDEEIVFANFTTFTRYAHILQLSNHCYFLWIEDSFAFQ